MLKAPPKRTWMNPVPFSCHLLASCALVCSAIPLALDYSRFVRIACVFAFHTTANNFETNLSIDFHSQPAWNQVAQQLSPIDPNIIVGRIDCTRYSAATTHFQIKGFPTIMYINRDKKIEFRGDRSVSEIVDFALRITGPPLRYIADCSRLNEFLRHNHRPVFVNFGPATDRNFTELSQALQPYDWFYRSMIVCDGYKPGTYVLKGNNVIRRFDHRTGESLEKWIQRERFAQFSKFTPTILSLAIQLKKLLVIAVVREYRQSNRLIDADNVAFHQLIESIAHTYPNEHQQYLFGWSSDHSTMNSIVMHTITTVPNLIVLNSSTIQYYLWNDGSMQKIGDHHPDQVQLMRQSIIQWLDDIVSHPDRVKPLGGDSYHHRLYRTGYDLITFFVNLWLGNPTLTLIVFGVPATFLSVLIYFMCCSEWSAVEEEEDTGEAGDEDFDDEDDVDEAELDAATMDHMLRGDLDHEKRE